MKQDKILIIDDDEEILGIYSKILSKKGYKVEVAADGLAGFNKVLEYKPNLILLDMILPNMKGLEILEKIKSNPNLDDIYILLITASSDVNELLLKGLKAGADGYFMKPIRNTELVARIDAAFRHINTILRLKMRENELLVLNKTSVERNEELKKLNINLKESQSASLNLLSDLKDEIEERELVQKAFIQSEKQFRDLISNVRLLSVTLDLEGNITFCNDYLLELTGWKYDEIIGKSWFKNFLPQNFADEVLEIFQKGIQYQDYPLYHVNEILTRNGEKRIVEWNNTILRDSEGSVVGAATIGNDITIRKRAEKALLDSNSMIERIIDNVPVRIFWKDKNLVYQGCNQEFAKDAGFSSSDEIIGKDDYQMGWSEQAELYMADDKQVIESGKPKLLIEEEQTTPQGKKITLITSKIPTYNSNGKIDGMLGTYLDITNRKRIEEKLRISEERLRLANKATNDVIWDWDIITNTQTWNESGAIILVGKRLWSILKIMHGGLSVYMLKIARW